VAYVPFSSSKFSVFHSVYFMTLAITLFAFVPYMDCDLVSVRIMKFLNERDWRYSIMPRLLESDSLQKRLKTMPTMRTAYVL
jgi:hypothetical protein